jgi:selenocysteine lyase/cysteine desulfurase
MFLGAMSAPLVGAWPRPSLAAESLNDVLDFLDQSQFAAAPESFARDEDFWHEVGRAFTVDRSVINLNNGGVSPSPGMVQEAMKRHLDFANSQPPPVALWRIQEPQKERVREGLARQWGVDPEEIAITRNSSESLQICQLGIDLERGDEILTTNQDYPRMLTTFRQRERREGVVLKTFSLPVPCESDDEVVRLFEENISPRTKLILMCHMINLTGQILPVKRVVAMARAKGIPVIVDGAHALAHFDFKLSDLDCDYYGVSLHKWLFAPHGTGLLYVRQEKIRGLWPLMAAEEKLDDDIRKFEEIGTHPAANSLATAEALTFHQAIGGARKEARLRYLRDSWANRLLAFSDRVTLHTSLRPEFSCGIANVSIDGLDQLALSDWLWEKKQILTTAIEHDEFTGLRITPSVYTTREELDRFCEAIEWVIENGVPEEDAAATR